MGNKFDICDGHIQFFPTFAMKNFRPVRSFPIIFPLNRMEILDVLKFSDYISIAKDGNCRIFEDFRLYSLFKGWKYPTIQRKEITEFYGKQ